MMLLTGRRQLLLKKNKGFTPLENNKGLSNTNGNALAKNKKRSLTGFTLIELLLVTVILLILAGMAVPSFRKTHRNLELNDAANKLAYLMRFANAKAVMERLTYRLNFDAEKNRCWLTRQTGEGNDSFVAVSSKFARGIVFPKGIEVEVDVEAVNFLPDGKIDPVSIYLKNKDNKAVTISTKESLGNVQVLDFRA